MFHKVKTMPKESFKKKLVSVGSKVIFWGYNILGLFYIGLTAASEFFILFSPRSAVPWNIALCIYILVLLPISALLLGIFTNIKHHPDKLLKVFFAVELPIIGLTLARLIFIREMTPIMWLFFLSILVSIIGFLIYTFYPKIKSKFTRAALILSQEIALILAGYAVLLFLFLLPILAAVLFDGIMHIPFGYLGGMFLYTKGLVIVQILVFLVLFFSTVGLFVVSPFVATFVYLKVFKELKEKFIKNYGKNYTRILTYSFCAVYIILTIGLSLQVNNVKTDLFKSFNEAKTFEDQNQKAYELLKDPDGLKRSLTNAYLSSYRYITDTNNQLLIEPYDYYFNTNPDQSKAIQNLFNALSAPFVYAGNFNTDISQAAENYQKIFDQSIQDGERDAIQKALGSTNNRGEAKAGLLDKDQKTVRLLSKNIEINTSVHDLLAKVSIDESYENTTDDVQEVYYEFSLPENSVMTGLWLGNDLEYPATVSPKGAARSTYESQVTRYVDPALLEQVGPRQYRLRVFPVPVHSQFPSTQSNQENVSKQRVKIEYITLLGIQGFGLPKISESRNVFEDGGTKKTLKLNQNVQNFDWKNSFVTMNSNGCSGEILTTDTGNGIVEFVPHFLNTNLQKYYPCTNAQAGQAGGQLSEQSDVQAATEIADNAEKIPENLKIAILLDASYSSKDIDWVAYILQNIPQNLVIKNNVELYYFNEKMSEKINFDLPMFQAIGGKGLPGFAHFGRTDRLKALYSLDNSYDAVLMLTDGSSFDLANKTKYTVNNAAITNLDNGVLKVETQSVAAKDFSSTTPIYIVHADKKIPSYPDDLTMLVLKSHGGVFTDLKEAIENLWLEKIISKNSAENTGNDSIQGFPLHFMDITPEGTWFFKPAVLSSITANKFTEDPEHILRKLASKELIDSMIQTENSGEDSKYNEMLKKIHEIAKEESIVSPFSSMIALVNSWQKEQLKTAENESDAFKATENSGDEYLNQPQSLGQTAGFLDIGSTPEPHEWALMILAGLLLSYFNRRQILQFLRAGLR